MIGNKRMLFPVYQSTFIGFSMFLLLQIAKVYDVKSSIMMVTAEDIPVAESNYPLYLLKSNLYKKSNLHFVVEYNHYITMDMTVKAMNYTIQENPNARYI
jgi:hypothetical protein